jgi:hypothetical protein
MLLEGKDITQETIKEIIDKCDLSDSIKNKLLKLKPSDYIGLARKLTLKKN